MKTEIPIIFLLCHCHWLKTNYILENMAQENVPLTCVEEDAIWCLCPFQHHLGHIEMMEMIMKGLDFSKLLNKLVVKYQPNKGTL